MGILQITPPQSFPENAENSTACISLRPSARIKHPTYLHCRLVTSGTQMFTMQFVKSLLKVLACRLTEIRVHIHVRVAACKRWHTVLTSVLIFCFFPIESRTEPRPDPFLLVLQQCRMVITNLHIPKSCNSIYQYHLKNNETSLTLFVDQPPDPFSLLAVWRIGSQRTS